MNNLSSITLLVKYYKAFILIGYVTTDHLAMVPICRKQPFNKYLLMFYMPLRLIGLTKTIKLASLKKYQY